MQVHDLCVDTDNIMLLFSLIAPLPNFEIRVGNTDAGSGPGATIANTLCASYATPSLASSFTLACSAPVVGRYLVVRSTASTALQLCEVEAYGLLWRPPPRQARDQPPPGWVQLPSSHYCHAPPGHLLGGPRVDCQCTRTDSASLYVHAALLHPALRRPALRRPVLRRPVLLPPDRCPPAQRLPAQSPQARRHPAPSLLALGHRRQCLPAVLRLRRRPSLSHRERVMPCRLYASEHACHCTRARPIAAPLVPGPPSRWWASRPTRAALGLPTTLAMPSTVLVTPSTLRPTVRRPVRRTHGGARHTLQTSHCAHVCCAFCATMGHCHAARREVDMQGRYTVDFVKIYPRWVVEDGGSRKKFRGSSPCPPRVYSNHLDYFSHSFSTRLVQKQHYS